MTCIAARLTPSTRIAQDPGVGHVPIEVVHLYNDEYPQGRKISNYAHSFDQNNIAYSIAELTSNNTETPYPSAAINLPLHRAINVSTIPVIGANHEKYLISVQSVVIEPIGPR
ncbi:hypothetical protein N7G274_007332 [Stereocaulon virgatum]|uniref:Uncharacterized protein n=1 Tax=Stereocaulon virgatum TaxID=373712 RepID=A0ABR4A1U2_9LECA